MKIGLGFAAVAICGALYGPWWACICAGIGDLIGSLIFPTGAYFPGFTVTAALTGLLFGALLRPFTVKKALLAGILNVVIVSFFCNTAMIAYLTGGDYTKLLAARAVQIAVMLPVQCAVLAVVLPMILKRIKIGKNRGKNKNNS